MNIKATIQAAIRGTLIVILACTWSLIFSHGYAQGPVQKTSPPFAFGGEWGPAAIPTSPTNLCIAQQNDSCTATRTFYITQITLSNRSATADTCYIVDRQSSPVSLFGTAAVPMSLSGSTSYEMVATAGRKMVGGMTWACTNGTVDAHVVYGY